LANKTEKRKHPRIKARWPISVLIDHGTIEGETRNITVDGMFICCDKPLPLNKIFRMSIIPTNHEAVEVTGKVLWSDFYGIDNENTTLGMGICFVKISDRDRRFFKDMVSAHPNPE
jgi:hypothetical protein